jgi:putative tryptophan/tyrosine transport system substrate-binding protein
MKRRDFFKLVAGAVAIARPARAQQADSQRRIGVLMSTTPQEPASEARIAALQQGLEEAGWTVGRNLKIETRWSGGDPAKLRKDAAELMASNPDVAVAGVGPTVQALQQASRSVPIVMVQSLDPVGAGFVKKLSRPGGNTTGFMQFEYGLSGKWLDLLLEIAPSIKRVGVVRDTEGVAGTGQWAVIQAFGSPRGVELSPINLSVNGDTRAALSEFAEEGPDNGLIIAVATIPTIQHDLIISTAAHYRIPAVYPYRFFVDAGGLVSYGPSLIDLYRRAATYVDRILRGEKPGDLPVQAPTKYELVINLKTARAMSINIPSTLLTRADEVIE